MKDVNVDGSYLKGGFLGAPLLLDILNALSKQLLRALWGVF
jgi:hypothetical protein